MRARGRGHSRGAGVWAAREENAAAVRPPACPGGRQTIAILCESRSRSTRHLGILTCIFSKQSHAHACNNSSLLFLPPGRTSIYPPVAPCLHWVGLRLVDFRSSSFRAHPVSHLSSYLPVHMCMSMHLRACACGMYHCKPRTIHVSNYLLIDLPLLTYLRITYLILLHNYCLPWLSLCAPRPSVGTRAAAACRSQLASSFSNHSSACNLLVALNPRVNHE